MAEAERQQRHWAAAEVPPTVIRVPSTIDSVGLPGYMVIHAPKASLGRMMIPVPGESNHIEMTVV